MCQPAPIRNITPLQQMTGKNHTYGYRFYITKDWIGNSKTDPMHFQLLQIDTYFASHFMTRLPFLGCETGICLFQHQVHSRSTVT